MVKENELVKMVSDCILKNNNYMDLCGTVEGRNKLASVLTSRFGAVLGKITAKIVEDAIAQFPRNTAPQVTGDSTKKSRIVLFCRNCGYKIVFIERLTREQRETRQAVAANAGDGRAEMALLKKRLCQITRMPIIASWRDFKLTLPVNLKRGEVLPYFRAYVKRMEENYG